MGITVAFSSPIVSSHQHWSSPKKRQTKQSINVPFKGHLSTSNDFGCWVDSLVGRGFPINQSISNLRLRRELKRAMGRKRGGVCRLPLTHISTHINSTTLHQEHHHINSPSLFLTWTHMGQIKWKKHKKSWPFPKLIFCHQWSLLDWTRMIQALFCVPGPHRGRGGPILGFGGPEGSKIWNFQTGPLLTVRCNFFDLNSL